MINSSVDIVIRKAFCLDVRNDRPVFRTTKSELFAELFQKY
jgi:hypothetical protein